VSEITHDAADDGFHEIQLSGKQLVFLFIVTTSVIVAVFLCGVLVGRGARAARGEEADLVPDATLAPQPATDSGPPSAAPPAPAAERADDLSYYKRLQGEKATTEALKPQPPPAAKEPVAAPRPAAPAPVPADVPVSGRPGTWVVQVHASRDRAVAIALVRRLVGKGYSAFLVTPPPGVVEQYYKVHIGRFSERNEAEKISLRLKKEEQFQPWITR